MASLREIKDHIGSVRSTLKITSAMKLVASAKLRKAQQAVEGMRPYEEALNSVLMSVQASAKKKDASKKEAAPKEEWSAPASGNAKVAIVAVASNSSLCGAFNVNVIRKVQEVLDELKVDGNPEVEIFALGRKMAEAARKAGFATPVDYSSLVGHSSFEQASALAQTLIDGYNSGLYSRVILIYNHFVSTSSQKVLVETYLPLSSSSGAGSPSETRATLGAVRGGTVSEANGGAERSEAVSEGLPSAEQLEEEYIIEPSEEEVLETLLPQVMRLRIYTIILDSVAAEHAARTIAMQTATDNAEDLLGELTLEYNKGRQQKITSEILDLVGGAQQ